ncbi:hypothetical protein MUK42_24378 [Musa troglodytarum]|uniref:Uncharacterized protein n=1 Tax=Musa troglodytarum TaxID=320322 RepID=A0A9E7G9X1_9LILI|nr:hypothetical protein MUK42_24378 [Musa troglodytarum]
MPSHIMWAARDSSDPFTKDASTVTPRGSHAASRTGCIATNSTHRRSARREL